MNNYISKTFSFIKSFMFYLIYYRPTKAALNFIDNYVTSDNFIQGIIDRWDEESLIIYYQKLEYKDINIFNYDNKTLDLIYENLVNENYITLMLMIMTHQNMRINDYYKFYLLVKDNKLLKEKLYENLNFRKHIIKYIEKSKLKFNENISFKVIYKKTNNLNNNISCALCFEDIIQNDFYSKCKICKTEMDIPCLNQWIKMEKNNCIMCRKYLLDDNESYNLILLQKYLDYLIISKELDLYRFNEFPT